MQLFTGNRITDLLKGFSLLIVLYCISTIVDRLLPPVNAGDSISGQHLSRMHRRLNWGNEAMFEQINNTTKGFHFKSSDTAFLELENGDKVELSYSPLYHVVHNYSYYNLNQKQQITESNRSMGYTYFPWLQLLVLGINLLTLLPRFREFSMVFRPFMFGFILFVVLMIINRT